MLASALSFWEWGGTIYGPPRVSHNLEPLKDLGLARDCHPERLLHPNQTRSMAITNILSNDGV